MSVFQKPASALLLVAGFLVAGCERGAEPPAGVLRAYVWNCDGGPTLRMKNLYREDAITLELHEGPRKLPHVPSASGAKYADETLTLWTKGEEALFERVGQPAANCRQDRARSLAAETLDGGGTAYVGMANGGPIRITVTPEPCQDDMSGQAFTHRVVIEHDGRRYRGCGSAD